MQELWSYGGFCQGFKGKPRRPGGVWQSQSLCKASLERMMYEAVQMKPMLQWRTWDVRDARNMGREATGSEQSQSRERLFNGKFINLTMF
jgi:hypothetical protein